MGMRLGSAGGGWGGAAARKPRRHHRRGRPVFSRWSTPAAARGKEAGGGCGGGTLGFARAAWEDDAGDAWLRVWQSVVAYVNITLYYLIGIPLGAVLGYVVGFHVKGIWIGMLLGTLVQTIVLLFITLRTDWEKQVEIAQESLKKWYMGENRRPQASRENA